MTDTHNPISPEPPVARECSEVTWIPDVVHPVSWGVHSLTQKHGAPRDVVIYYPSCRFGGTPAAPNRRQLETAYYPTYRFNAAPIYKLSTYRWPLLLFLHGRMPYGTAHSAWHRMWGRLASTAARCGYVVVVPRHDATPTPSTQDVALAIRDVDWVRNQWSESEWVAKLPKFTAVGGHSNGALLAAEVADAHPDFGALVSLGGHFGGGVLEEGPYATLRRVTIPSFLMWTPSSNQENLGAGLWEGLTQRKYAAVYQGTHFDYLEASDTGTLPRGACPYIAGVAADMVTLFMTRWIDPQFPGLVQIPIDLRRPQGQLTSAQASYADGQFASLDQISVQVGCRLDLRWNISGSTGSRLLGPE